MASEISIQVLRDAETPIISVDSFNRQVLLSVRKFGDKFGPQTGDVVLDPDMAQNFEGEREYKKNQIVVNEGILYRARETFLAEEDFDEINWEALGSKGDLTYVNDVVVEEIIH